MLKKKQYILSKAHRKVRSRQRRNIHFQMVKRVNDQYIDTFFQEILYSIKKNHLNKNF